MNIIYQAKDGAIFNTLEECNKYEETLKKEGCFEKTKFYCSYGTEIKKYDGFVHLIKVDPSEFTEVKNYISKRNRNFKGESESNIYFLRNMTFYPIEEETNRIKENIKHLEKELNNLQKIIKKITKEE